MKLKIDEITIPEENPFANCKLDRKIYADILESIVSNGNDGCVMSLDGAWGTGKTTFVRMWQQQLINNGFKTIYFNAWEHDYMPDPLVALIGELHNVSKDSHTSASLKKIVAEAGKIFCGVVPSVLKAIAQNYMGEGAADILKSGLDETKSIFQKELDKYKEECNSLHSFRDALAEFAEGLATNKPLVFIVDELDRCNPTFAVKVLERIKHLFAIPRIVFVLAIDKVQLCNSICGFYGSDRINANEYLRRFIDVEYNLPAPDYEKYLDFLYEKFGLGEYFAKISGDNYYTTKSYQEMLCNFPLKFISSKEMSLRQIEKLMAHIRLALQTISKTNDPCPDLIAFFVYLRQYKHTLYSDIMNRSLEVQQLVKALENLIPMKLYSKNDGYNKDYSPTTIYIVAKVLVAYASDYRCDKRVDLYKEIAGDKIQLVFNTCFPKVEMENAIQSYSKQYHAIPLEYLFRHIELLCSLQD